MEFVVTDRFEIKVGLAGTRHAPGVVTVVKTSRKMTSMPAVGDPVTLVRPDGWSRIARIEAVKTHGAAYSFFFRGLKLNELPVGTKVGWDRKMVASLKGRPSIRDHRITGRRRAG